MIFLRTMISFQCAIIIIFWVRLFLFCVHNLFMCYDFFFMCDHFFLCAIISFCVRWFIFLCAIISFLCAIISFLCPVISFLCAIISFLCAMISVGNLCLGDRKYGCGCTKVVSARGYGYFDTWYEKLRCNKCFEIWEGKTYINDYHSF